MARSAIARIIPRFAAIQTPLGGARAPVAVLIAAVCITSTVSAAGLDEMSLDRWKQLREVERYQLKIAEDYYRKKSWKVAADEYEKFLTLYERSEGAPYSLLKWSLCQLQLRKQHTAISEGFQSVVDYWPDAPEATAAAYYVGQTYKNIGEVKKAKKAYSDLLQKHGKHLVAVYALHDLIEISKVEQDLDARVALWKKLTFDAQRTKESRNFCIKASQELGTYYLHEAAFDDGVKALATTYAEADLPNQVFSYTRAAAGNLNRQKDTQPKAARLVDRGIAWLKQQEPDSLADDDAKKQAMTLAFHAIDLNSAIGRHAKVVEQFAAMEQRFGLSDEILDKRGDWLRSREEYDKARLVYNRFKDQITGQQRIAETWWQQRKYDQAALAYQQTLNLDPENPVKWKKLIASSYYHAGKPDPAIATYRELIVDDAQHGADWEYAIGYALQRFGRHQEAIKQYATCDKFPENYMRMAECYESLKQWKQAIQTYAQVVSTAERESKQSEALIHIGYCYEKAESKESAIRAFQQVCKKYPKSSHASTAHARLQKDYGITVTFGGGKDD